MYNKYNALNTASFNINLKTNNNYNETAGLYKINVSQVDYDLYKINRTDYHLSTKDVLKWVKVLTLNLKFIIKEKLEKKIFVFK